MEESTKLDYNGITMRDLRSLVAEMLESRGVSLLEVAELVYALQSDHKKGLSLEECLQSVWEVLGKREVQHALLTGMVLDELAERGALPEPLQSIVASDEPLYGVDETLALGITNVYGTIGLTNFGYLDKVKSGVIGHLVEAEKEGAVHTFLDDLVAGLAAAAAAKLAHNRVPREVEAAG